MAAATKDKPKADAPKAEQKQRASSSEAVGQKSVKVTLPAGTLRGALRDVIGAVSGRSEIPILSHVLVEGQGGSLALTATDLDLWITRTLSLDSGPASSSAAVGDKDGDLPLALALPAKALDKLLGELEAACPVTLEIEDGENRATLRAGRSRYRLVRLPAEDFPRAAPFTSAAALDLPCAALADALGSVRHAISTEETRYYLNGVFVHADPDGEAALLLAATDGHRLARGRLPAVEGAETFPGLIWMRTMVGLLEKLLAAGAKTGSEADRAMVLVEAEGEGAGSRLRFVMPAADGGETLLVAKSIDGTFPAYDRVLPTAFEGSATFDKDALSAAVRRVAAIASEKTRAVKVEFTADRATLDVSCPELGEASAEVPCMGPESPATIGFNADFLVTALAQAPGQEVVLSFADAIAPTLLLGSGADPATTRLLQVLMPMRV